MPATATSGIYIARPTRPDTRAGSHIPFIVRDDDGHSDLLFQTSDTTWQAYNPYGGWNAYTSSFSSPSPKISYNRPFTSRGGELENWLFNAEYPMLRWLERNGYDVSYSTSIDTGVRGAEILEHEVFMSVGHDEYWPQAKRDSVTAAREAGVNLAFLSGNEIYWKVRSEDSAPDGVDNDQRTMVVYKEGTKAWLPEEHRTCVGAPQPYECDPSDIWTGLCREASVKDPSATPENSLSGQISWRPAQTNIKVPGEYAKLRFWRDTDVAALNSTGTVTLADGTLGYEFDPYQEAYAAWYPAGRIKLSTTFAEGEMHTLSLYRAASEALVFGAGTVQWSWGLDDVHDHKADFGGTQAQDENIQQATVNLFADMGVQPATIQSGLVTQSASQDTQKPTVTISSPAGGATVASGSTVTVTGTAADAGAGEVAGVEVSTDGGTSWRARPPVEARGSSRSPPPPALANRSRSRPGRRRRPEHRRAGLGHGEHHPARLRRDDPVLDLPGDRSQHNRVQGRQQHHRGRRPILEPGHRPDHRDPLLQCRQHAGAFTGKLYANGGGTSLATTATAALTGPGWYSLPLTTPVEITPGTSYVASYYSASGWYAASNQGFLSAVINNPLTAPANTAENPNGLYHYGEGFPNSGTAAANYWVDVEFESGADTKPPTVTAQSPAPGATGVAPNSKVQVTFSEVIDPDTVDEGSFTLAGPGGAAVAVTVSATGATATLTPTTALELETQYTATVTTQVSDAAGNQLVEAATWSFTTSATDEYTLFGDASAPAANDPDDYELGTRFSSSEDGYVTAIRFLKGSGNTGTHSGRLWASSGNLLATVTFADEGASGWQKAILATPVAIAAEDEYVVSYSAPNGHYAATSGYFAGHSATSGPLTAPANSGTKPNGIFNTTAGQFPTSTYGAHQLLRGRRVHAGHRRRRHHGARGLEPHAGQRRNERLAVERDHP